MRLDKYLKVSRIIKRRTAAKEACEGGRVIINGTLKAKILDIKNHTKKEDAQKMYEIITDTKDVK